jgi:hypothetical protein
MNWVSVQDKAPPDRKKVLGLDICGAIRAVWMCDGKWKGLKAINPPPAYWIEIPELPWEKPKIKNGPPK